jgi:hypothetical protein
MGPQITPRFPSFNPYFSLATERRCRRRAGQNYANLEDLVTALDAPFSEAIVHGCGHTIKRVRLRPYNRVWTDLPLSERTDADTGDVMTEHAPCTSWASVRCGERESDSLYFTHSLAETILAYAVSLRSLTPSICLCRRTASTR